MKQVSTDCEFTYLVNQKADDHTDADEVLKREVIKSLHDDVVPGELSIFFFSVVFQIKTICWIKNEMMFIIWK